MGLGDLKAKLLLFFVRKLRDWANSINENVQSPPLQPASVAVDRRGSEPVTEPGPDDDALDSEPSHPFARVSSGPPQHWVDLVRERAPGLLSLTPEYSPPEVALPEDHAQGRRSDGDEVEKSDQRLVNVPTGKENVDRKSEAVPLLPPKVGKKRSSRKTTRMSFLPRPKPLTLKPLSEPNPRLQPPGQDRDQITEPVKPAQLIKVRDQVTEPVKPGQLIELFGTDKRTVTSADRFSPDTRNKDHVATRESAQQASQKAPRSDTISASHEITKPATQISAAQAPGLNDTRKSEDQRPAFNVVRKPPSGPRRYLQAIIRVTRKTLRPTTRREVQSAQATVVESAQVTAVNFLNPTSQRSSTTPDVVRVVEASKTRPPVRYETPQTPVIQRSERKPEPVAYQRLRAPEPAKQQASPLTRLRPKVPVDNVKTTSRFPSTVEFPRPASRVATASNAPIQDAFVNMPALMDEEKMNRASSMHLANLQPGKNQWPDLPPATSMEVADELAVYERDIERMRRLKQEQRGTPWNE